MSDAEARIRKLEAVVSELERRARVREARIGELEQQVTQLRANVKAGG